jgi:hypothetical protein
MMYSDKAKMNAASFYLYSTPHLEEAPVTGPSSPGPSQLNSAVMIILGKCQEVGDRRRLDHPCGE